jgi:hypothetical protein
MHHPPDCETYHKIVTIPTQMVKAGNNHNNNNHNKNSNNKNYNGNNKGHQPTTKHHHLQSQVQARWQHEKVNSTIRQTISENNIVCCNFWLGKEQTAKGHQHGYLMKGLGSKNMLFIFCFSCLFTFFKHKQWFLYVF